MASKKASSAGNQQERPKKNKIGEILSPLFIIVGAYWISQLMVDWIVNPTIGPLNDNNRQLAIIVTAVLFIGLSLYIEHKRKSS